MGSAVNFRLGMSVFMVLALCGSVAAQRARSSTLETNTSLTFHQYLHPFPRLGSAQACRDTCVRDSRCTGWTYYHADFDGSADARKLRRMCILGAGLKDRQSGNKPGRTSGEIQ